MRRVTALLIFLFLGGVILRRSMSPVEDRISGSAMGTTWNVQWRGAKQDRQEIRALVSGNLEKWEQVLSQWRESSDLSQFNNGAPASPELQHVISLADEFSDRTNGAFDHRLLHETRQAGFGPPGSGVDLSAIGKGFAVDQVAERLKQAGMKEFLFELGGEIIAVGEGWEVGIEAPDVSGVAVSRRVVLNNEALATSGNYRLFEQVPGGLKSHILDPVTKKPVIRRPISVSVVAKDCTTADAWATALFVLGKGFPAPEGIDVFWNDGSSSGKN
ncbi:MAG: FAD:protein FMN transferase [Akkermansiaceae bacterium]